MTLGPRVALVTGAAQGIGLAIAVALAETHRLVLVDRNAAALEAAAARFEPGGALALPVDLRDADAPARLARDIGLRWGSVAVLVNNAGVSSSKRGGRAASVVELTDDEWRDVLDINLGAAFRLCREFLPAMIAAGWGRVINISSMAGRTRSLIAAPNYMASKAGLIALTRSIAAEFGPQGVTANAIAPGLIATPMAAQRPPDANAAVLAQIPVRRMGRPEEIAAAVRYLAADEAGFVNGAVLDVNGGVFMN